MSVFPRLLVEAQSTRDRISAAERVYEMQCAEMCRFADRHIALVVEQYNASEGRHYVVKAWATSASEHGVSVEAQLEYPGGMRVQEETVGDDGMELIRELNALLLDEVGDDTITVSINSDYWGK